MRLAGIVQMCSTAALLGGGAALGACPDACCADEKTATLSVMEPERGTHESIVVVDDDTTIEIRIVDGKVTATINGEKVDPDRVHRSDGGWVIESEDGAGIVVRLPGMSERGVLRMMGDEGRMPMLEVRLDEDVEHGMPPRGVIGVSIGEPDEGELEDLGVDGGVRIDGVFDGSPADEVGLREGDLIVGLGDHEVRDIEDLHEAMRGRKPGQEVQVQVVRNGKKKVFRVTLAPARALEIGVDQVIELAPPTIGVDVREFLERLKDSGVIHLDDEAFEELDERVRELRIELAPLDRKIRRRVFAEIEGYDGGKVFGEIMVPRLKMAPGVGVFRFDDDEGAGVFRFRRDGMHGDHEAAFMTAGPDELRDRLDAIEDRLNRLDRKLDRLIRALGSRE